MGGQWQAPKGWQRIRQQVFATYGHTCWRCGAYASSVDHVRPVILGGTHDLANLRPCCSRCNRSAGAAVRNQLRGRRRTGRPQPRRYTRW